MVFRQAQITDIIQIQQVRNSVNENRLSDPRLVTNEDVKIFIIEKGKGWVCEAGKEIVGFSIVDLKEKNIWALFVKPENEGCGIGKELHRKMLDWYFSLTMQNVWLGTAPNIRAAKFYEIQGWKKIGMHGKKEIKFEMEFATWHKK